MTRKAGRIPGITFASPDKLLILLLEMGATKERIDEINNALGEKGLILAPMEYSSIGLSGLLNSDKGSISDTIGDIEEREGKPCVKKTDRIYRLIPGSEKEKILTRVKYEIHHLTEHGEIVAQQKLEDLKKSIVRIKDGEDDYIEMTIEECNQLIRRELNDQRRFYYYALMGDLVQDREFTKEEIYRCFPFKMDIHYQIRIPKVKDVQYHEFIEDFIPKGNFLFNKIQEFSNLSNKPEHLMKLHYTFQGKDYKKERDKLEDEEEEWEEGEEPYDEKEEVVDWEINDLYNKIIQTQYSLITGESGSGKSTLISQLSRYSLSVAKLPTYPIYLEFSSYMGGSIFKWILKKIKNDNDPREVEYGLEQAIEERRLILMIDGLDENPSQVEEFFENVNQFSEENPGVNYVLTSRYRNLFTDKGNIISISPLNMERRDKFIKEYLHDEERSNNIIKMINVDPNIKELSFNPMMLNILCVLFTQTRKIPRNRHQLYHEITHFLISWGSDRVNTSNLVEDELIEIFSSIAYSLTDRKTTHFQIQEMENLNPHYSKMEITKVINQSVKSDSIIIKIGDGYQFFHKSFQEYFTSVWIETEVKIDYVIKELVKDIDWWYPVILIYAANKNVSSLIKEINETLDEDIFYSKIRLMSRLAIQGKRCDRSLINGLFLNLIDIYLKNRIWDKEHFSHVLDTKNRAGSFKFLIDNLAIKLNDYKFIKEVYERSINGKDVVYSRNVVYHLPNLFLVMEFILERKLETSYIIEHVDIIDGFIRSIGSEEMKNEYHQRIIGLFNNYREEEKNILYYGMCLELVQEEPITLNIIKTDLEKILLQMKKNEIIQRQKYVNTLISFIRKIIYLLDPDVKRHSNHFSKEMWKWMKDILYYDEIDNDLSNTIFGLLKEDIEILKDFSPEGFIPSKKTVEDSTFSIERRIWILENDSEARNRWVAIANLSTFFSMNVSKENAIIFSTRIVDICERLIETEKDLVIRNGMIGLIRRYSYQNYLNKIMNLHEKYKNDPLWENDIETSIDDQDIEGQYGFFNNIRYFLSPSLTYLHSIILIQKSEEYFEEQKRFAIQNLVSQSVACSRLSFDFLIAYGDNESHFQAVKWLLKSGNRFQIQFIEGQGPLAIDPRIFTDVFTIFLGADDYAQLCHRLHPLYSKDENLKRRLNRILIRYPGVPDANVLMDSMDFDDDGYNTPIICNYILATHSRELIKFDNLLSDRISEYLIKVIKKYIENKHPYINFRNEFLKNIIVLIDRFGIKPDILDMICILDDINDLTIDNLRYYLRSYNLKDWVLFKDHISGAISNDEKKLREYRHFIKFLDLYKEIPDNNYQQWKSEFHDRIFDFYDEMKETPDMVWIFDSFFDSSDIQVLFDKYLKWKEFPINRYILVQIYEKSSIKDFNQYIVKGVKDGSFGDFSSIIYDYLWGEISIGEISEDEKYNLLYSTIWTKSPNQRAKLLEHRFSSQHFIESLENEFDNEIIRSGILSLSRSCYHSLVDKSKIDVKHQGHNAMIIDFIEKYLSKTNSPLFLSSCIIILKNLNPLKFTDYVFEYLNRIISLEKGNMADFNEDTFINPVEPTIISLPFFLMEAIDKGCLKVIDQIMEIIDIEIIKDPEGYISDEDSHYENIGLHLCKGARSSKDIMEYVIRYPVLLPLVEKEIDYHFRGSGYFSRKEMGLEDITYDLDNPNS